jgi:prepilin-type N-terminal cleavage/methylation domain-containing protein
MHLAAKTMIGIKFKIQNSRFKIPAAGERGLTMVELMIAMTISTVLILVVGVLLEAGQRCWRQTYDLVNQQIKQDALATTATFGSVGRKANRNNYFLYAVNGGAFSPVEPQTSDQEVVYGDAVEFRYWDVELDESDSHQLMDVTKQATAYAFFYLEDGTLKVDYGPYPPGAVPAGGGSRNTDGVTTITLAENVAADPNTGAFGHTTISRIGQGCVRINVTLTDPADGDSVSVKTATLMRNIWPR